MNTENIGAQILSEHQGLRALLRDLEAQVQQPLDSEPGLERVRATLTRVVDLCTEHFALEERAGLHVQLRDQSPRLASRLEKLLSEHSSILETLQKLVAALSAQPSGPGEAEASKERVLSAIEAIREHERAENEVMTDAYWEDLGGEAG